VERKPKGYWTEKKISTELSILKDKIGHNLSFQDLRNFKLFGIVRAIRRIGKSKFNLCSKRKPNGYWKESTIIKELNDVILSIYHFPTVRELELLKKYNLNMAIQKNKGINYYRKTMGYELKQISPGSWTFSKKPR